VPSLSRRTIRVGRVLRLHPSARRHRLWLEIVVEGFRSFGSACRCDGIVPRKAALHICCSVCGRIHPFSREDCEFRICPEGASINPSGRRRRVHGLLISLYSAASQCQPVNFCDRCSRHTPCAVFGGNRRHTEDAYYIKTEEKRAKRPCIWVPLWFGRSQVSVRLSCRSRKVVLHWLADEYAPRGYAWSNRRRPVAHSRSVLYQSGSTSGN